MNSVTKFTYRPDKYAEGYLSKGFAPIPVPYGQKNPAMAGWNDLRISEEDVTKYFDGGPQNLGILLGEPSGDLVDVDLDVPEAVTLADAFLAPTATSGREHSPRAHRWYRSPGADSVRFKDVDGKVLAELRSTGLQTLVEPSIHPGGDRYLWDRSNGMEMVEMPADDLHEACKRLATATIIARHMPPVGGRHDFALALAGYLLRPGRLDEEAVLNIMTAAWEAVDADSPDAVRDLEGIVRDTVRKLEAGEMVTGGPTLNEVVPGMVGVLARWWGWRRESSLSVPGPNPLSESPPRPKLAEEALYGLPGEIIKTIDPHTEADRVAVLANLLCAFGSAIGRGAYFYVGADQHHLKLNAGIVGETSKGRKGMSEGHVRRLMRAVDSSWEEDRVLNGLSTGEGLIHEVRDEVWDVNGDGEPVMKDAGVSDKRLLVSEPELARVLKVMNRETNTLSPVVRQAWDGDRLRVMTRTNPMRATGAHVSIIGHISKEELLKHLTETEAAAGFANRFLWLIVRRSKELAFGGEWRTVDTAPLIERLSEALEFGKEVGEITWGESAKPVWREVYGPLSEGKPGLFGAVVGRAEAQTVRLAALYAVMSLSNTIEAEHLVAALGLWEYAENSARYIFGDATKNTDTDRLHEALKGAGSEGMSRTEIRDFFRRNRSAEKIIQMLALLQAEGRAWTESEGTNGRPVQRWFAR